MRSDARKRLEGLCPCDSPNCSDAARKQQATVADVLAAHEPFGGGEFCSCTEPDEDGARLPLPVFWEEHLAAQLQPLIDRAVAAEAELAALRGRVAALAARLADAKAEAWDEAVHAVQTEAANWCSRSFSCTRTPSNPYRAGGDQ